jgi:hypothetical protein
VYRSLLPFVLTLTLIFAATPGEAANPATPPQADLFPCGSAITQCQPLEVSLIAWLKAYADRTTFEVKSDSRFEKTIVAATPLTVFHLGADVPLPVAIISTLSGPAFPVQLRDGRYLTIFAQRTARGGGESFYWFDLQNGITFGGIYFRPTNGEPTPSLTIFSGQVGDRVNKETQLPPAFLRDLEAWRAARNVPAAVVRYFVNGAAWKSPLLHDSDACAAKNASDACQTLNERAAELDMQAGLYLLRSRYAEGTSTVTQLDAAQQQWLTSRQTSCANKSDAAGCMAQMTRARAQEIIKMYSQGGDQPLSAPSSAPRPTA